MDKQKDIDRQVSRRTWIGFSVFAVTGALFAGAWSWLRNAAKETSGATRGMSKPLRGVLNANESIMKKAFSHDHLVKTYPKSMAAARVRVNSLIGIKDAVDAQAWRLQVERNPGDMLTVSLKELKQLPKTEIIYDFKCVEGWDQISHWGGVKFSHFIEYYHLQTQAGYAAFVTPDKKYYVGIDMPSALHPQTLLCYEVNGRPLPREHGAPLRLIIPVKYGIKNIKRIGTISFSNKRPPDYWAERGYDYYSGL